MSKIVRNTLYLYLRMLIVLGVSLYTSRVILQGLGVIDYGIYNVVAGLVVSFSFMTTTMSATSMRYYSIELGKGSKDNLVKLFNVNIQFYVIVSILFLIIAETVGLYLVYHVLNIPDDRFASAVVLFHLSVLACVAQILQTPFSSAIIACEQMSFYGYIGIVEAIAKLVVSVIICITIYDRLEVYGGLLLLIYVLLLLLYGIYARHRIDFCKYKRTIDRKLLKSILNFSGWSLFESVADILSIQGISILLNIFIGVVINAAVGISTQVTSVVWGFISNFQTAFKPQIIKYYSQGDKKNYTRLLVQTSKLSYFLYFVIATPIFFNLPLLFQLWLHQVPDYSVSISRIILVNLIFGTLAAPVWVLIQAQGNVKRYQIYVTSVMLLNFPFALIVLLLGLNPVFVFVARGVVACLTHISRLSFMRKQVNIGIDFYVKKVIFPLFICSVISIVPTFFVFQYTNGYLQLVMSSVVAIISSAFVFYYLGLDKSEKAVVKNYMNIITSKFCNV